MTVAVKVALNPNTTNISGGQYTYPCFPGVLFYLYVAQHSFQASGWFLAHLSTECSVSYCDHSPSVGVRPSIHNLLVNTLASTNINQSSPNLVKMYMTTRAWMSSTVELIRPELSELSALEFENLPYLTVFTL